MQGPTVCKKLSPKTSVVRTVTLRNFTQQAKPPLPQFSFGQQNVFLQSKGKRGSRLNPPVQRGRYLGIALSQISHSVSGVHRVWDLVANHVVIAAYVKPFDNPTRVSPQPLLGLEWQVATGADAGRHVGLTL